MAPTRSSVSRDEILKCDHCGDVIGMYEPIVVVVRGEARQTSQAAEPTLPSEAGNRYHLGCYLLVTAAE